jgi:hypothetical protein
LFEGSSLGLLFLKEESGGLNATTCRSSLLLGILALLDNGLEPSPESSGGGGRHGDDKGGGGALLRVAARYWFCPTEDSNWVVAAP